MTDDPIGPLVASTEGSRYSKLVSTLSGPVPTLRSDVPVVLAFFREKLASAYMRNLLESVQVPKDGE